MYTAKEKRAIRNHWFYLILRFKKDGTVEAKRPGGTFGLLYTEQDAINHLKAVGLRAEV